MFACAYLSQPAGLGTCFKAPPSPANETHGWLGNASVEPAAPASTVRLLPGGRLKAALACAAQANRIVHAAAQRLSPRLALLLFAQLGLATSIVRVLALSQTVAVVDPYPFVGLPIAGFDPAMGA